MEPSLRNEQEFIKTCACISRVTRTLTNMAQFSNDVQSKLADGEFDKLDKEVIAATAKEIDQLVLEKPMSSIYHLIKLVETLSINTGIQFDWSVPEEALS